MIQFNQNGICFFTNGNFPGIDIEGVRTGDGGGTINIHIFAAGGVPGFHLGRECSTLHFIEHRQIIIA